MQTVIFKINIQNREKVRELFYDNEIPFEEAGYPNGKVELIETFESKENIHADMQIYAKELGYEDLVDAIGTIGSAREFKRMFNENRVKV